MFPARRLARLAESEVSAEMAAQAPPRPTPGATGHQWLWGWGALAVVGVVFTWTGLSHLHILTFNAFLALTLALAFGTAACFPPRATA
jgi:hypothetical protein